MKNRDYPEDYERESMDRENVNSESEAMTPESPTKKQSIDTKIKVGKVMVILGFVLFISLFIGAPLLMNFVPEDNIESYMVFIPVVMVSSFVLLTVGSTLSTKNQTEKGQVYLMNRDKKEYEMAKANKKFCANCGNEIGADDKFCVNCGTEISKGMNEIEKR